jgi:hypothetical protein
VLRRGGTDAGHHGATTPARSRRRMRGCHGCAPQASRPDGGRERRGPALRPDPPSGQTGAIMIKGCERLLAIDVASAGARSQVCRLLGIDAQKRVASRAQLLEEMCQRAARLPSMRRGTTGQHFAHLAPGTTEPSEHPAHDAGSGTAGVFLQAVGHLLGCYIRPDNVLAQGVACGAVCDRVWYLLDPVRVCDFRLFASASGRADATARRLIGQLRELPYAVSDGLRIACKDLRDGAGAAMPQGDRFERCKAAAVLF